MKTAENAAFSFGDILRAVAAALETPVIIILILIIVAAVALLGWLIAELFGERRHMKVALPRLLDAMRAPGARLDTIVVESGLLMSQRAVLLELMHHPGFTPQMREALAVRLIEEEQAKYDRVVRYSELIAKLGPMFGLLGTLIPLGPGIIALGQGDTATLSASLLTAFDTTIAGLSAAAVASVVSVVRRAWYKNYMSMLDMLAECELEILKDGGGK